MPFIDIHTHKNINTEQIVSVYQEPLNSNTGIDYRQAKYYSLGVHPWFASEAALEQIKERFAEEKVPFVGEVGLDKRCDVSWEIQVSVFKKQLEYAKQSETPVIIHCVKAYSEVLKILDELKFTSPVIFHAFQSSTQMAQQITSQGYYLSFGKSLYQHREKSIDVLKNTSIESIFFETDDAYFSIRDLYSVAAAYLQCDLETLKIKIEENFNRIEKATL